MVATVLAYQNALGGPLIFDDVLAISQNPSIRSLWPPASVLFPPAECTVAGRPLVNVSLALNYAFGGVSPWGYHAVNVALHAIAALLLFAVVRRTLARGVDQPVLAQKALPLGFAIAAGWAVHPLLTGSVSYISQRTEIMAALFYLLAILGFIRSLEERSRAWSAISVAGGFAAVACKEGAVTVPLVILYFDRTFFSGSFRSALRQRGGYYAALASSWVLLAFLMSGLEQRAVGFGVGMSWWRYALIQCEAVWRYLSLSVWPLPLIFDYGVPLAESGGRTVGFVVLLACVLAAVGVAATRWPRAGFVGLTFFLLLAPTSSIVPIAAQPIAENRAYLPSAAVVVLLVVGAYWVMRTRFWFVGVMAGLALSWVAVQRNHVYRGKMALWTDTVAKRSQNSRAHLNLGEIHYESGDYAKARESFAEAVSLAPNYAEAHNSLGAVLQQLGDGGGARAHFESAVKLRPDYASAHNNLGNLLLRLGARDAAKVHLERAAKIFSDKDRLKPDLADVYNNLGNLALMGGDLGGSVRFYREALGVKPEFPQPRMNLGVALREMGQLDEARRELAEVVARNPTFPEAHYNLAVLENRMGRPLDAERHLKSALSLRPGFVEAHVELGDVCLKLNQAEQAHDQYQTALRLRPADSSIRAKIENLASLRRREPVSPGSKP